MGEKKRRSYEGASPILTKIAIRLASSFWSRFEKYPTWTVSMRKRIIRARGDYKRRKG